MLELCTARYNKTDSTEVYASHTKTFLEREYAHAMKFHAGGIVDPDVALALLNELSQRSP